MADNKKNIIELLKKFESTLQDINKNEPNDEASLKKILKDFCMKFDNDVTDTNELEGLIKNINLILGRIVEKYSKIQEDVKGPAASAEDAKTQAASTQVPPAEVAGSTEDKPLDPTDVLKKKGGKKRKTKNKKTKKHKKRRTKKLKKKKSKKYRKVNTKKH